MKKKNLAGMRFGRLVAIESASVLTGGRVRVVWRCKCDCGKESTVVSSALIASTRSCGCLHQESTAKINYKHGMSIGYKESREYSSWSGAKSRCYNPKDAKYPRYGGRGIKMCERWISSPELFLKDMGKCPVGLTLERIELDGDYSPDNCVWANNITQMRNTSTNVIIGYKNQKKTMVEWAEIFGINYKRFHSLYRYKNMSMEQLEKMGANYG